MDKYDTLFDHICVVLLDGISDSILDMDHD